MFNYLKITWLNKRKWGELEKLSVVCVKRKTYVSEINAAFMSRGVIFKYHHRTITPSLVMLQSILPV